MAAAPAPILLLPPDYDVASLNLKDIISQLRVLVRDVAQEFSSFHSPLSLLLPHETHRVAADALVALLRLRYQLKYFNAGFPRSSNSSSRSSSQEVPLITQGVSSDCFGTSSLSRCHHRPQTSPSTCSHQPQAFPRDASRRSHQIIDSHQPTEEQLIDIARTSTQATNRSEVDNKSCVDKQLRQTDPEGPKPDVKSFNRIIGTVTTIHTHEQVHSQDSSSVRIDSGQTTGEVQHPSLSSLADTDRIPSWGHNNLQQHHQDHSSTLGSTGFSTSELTSPDIVVTHHHHSTPQQNRRLSRTKSESSLPQFDNNRSMLLQPAIQPITTRHSTVAPAACAAFPISPSPQRLRYSSSVVADSAAEVYRNLSHESPSPELYRSLLERERFLGCSDESIMQRERRVLCISLCLPFLTLEERFCVIARLSTCFHRLAMIEAPITEADFCTPETEGLLLLPSFPRIAPQLPRTLRFLRVNCVEHSALSSLVGVPLEQLCLVNVPTPGGSSLLPSRLLPSATDMAQKEVAAFLSPLTPLSSWLFVVGKRCKNLKFLSLSFNPSLPFSVSNGVPNLQVSSPLISSLSIRTHRYISSVLSQYGFYSECGDTDSSSSSSSVKVSPVSSFFFNRLVSNSSPPLSFPSLRVLQFVDAASIMPLALLLCASFPRLETFIISTTSALFTGNLAEFLCLFASRCLQSSNIRSCRSSISSSSSSSGCSVAASHHQHFRSLIIHHASNIANIALLEAIKLFGSLQSLRLTSPNSFGSSVILSHSSVTSLELTYHRDLTWRLDAPLLKRLVFILPILDVEAQLPTISSNIKLTLADQLKLSPYLSEFILESLASDVPILEFLDRHSIQVYCFHCPDHQLQPKV